MRGTTHAAALATGLLVLGCARPPVRTTAADCNPPTGSLANDAKAASLAGRYALTLISTSGDSAGRRASGILTLERSPIEGVALLGTAGVSLESVGALRLGNLTSTDTLQPGIVVLEQPGSILLRLGSEANRRNVQRFDGGYTVLGVREIVRDGFRGTWKSGVTGDAATGYFCAVRETAGGA